MSEYAGRVMALDVGDVRTGIAMSDPMRIIASPHSTLAVRGLDEDCAEIVKLACDMEVSVIVVGMPLNREGGMGVQAEKVMRLVERLRAATPIDVVTQDERYSTAASQRMLIAADVSRKKRKQVVDKVAATNILQGYLDRAASSRPS